MSGKAKHTLEDFNDEMNDLELGLEKEAARRDFYRQAAETVTDPRVQSLYSWFTKAATLRIGCLEAVRTEAAASQTWGASLIDLIQAADKQAGEPPQFGPGDGQRPGRAEVTTLRQAIELEKEAASIYFTAAQRSREPNIRAFYRYLGPAEESHKQLLESYFDGFMKAVLKR